MRDASRSTAQAPDRGAGISASHATLLPELDGLRGLAIALVFLIHTEGVVEWGRPLDASGPFGWLRTLFYGGHTGVSLFFILSGFLVSRPFIAELAGGRIVDRRTYVRRRFWRIVPLYGLAVVATTAALARSSADLWKGLPYLFFLGSFVPRAQRLAPSVSSVWWSLSTEIQFYVLLPLVVLAWRTRRRLGVAIVLALAGLYGLAVSKTVPLSSDQSWWVLHSVIGRGPLFGYGVLAAWVCEHYGTRLRAWAAATPWVRNGGADAAFVAVLAALGVLLTSLMRTFGYVALEQGHATWHLVEGALWTSVLLLCVLTPLRAGALFRTRALGHTGRISYSIYLLHQPVLFALFYNLRIHYPDALPNAWQPVTIVATLAVAAVVLLLGHLTWTWIEQPLAWQEPAPRAATAPVLALVDASPARSGWMRLGRVRPHGADVGTRRPVVTPGSAGTANLT